MRGSTTYEKAEPSNAQNRGLGRAAFQIPTAFKYALEIQFTSSALLNRRLHYVASNHLCELERTQFLTFSA